MKRGFSICIIFLLALPSVIALSVTLNSPNNGNTTNMTTIIFSCSATETTFPISAINLYTNTSSGTWGSVATQSNSSTSAYFSLSGISPGAYIWNCQAQNTNNDLIFATSNFSFTVSTLSFSSPIPNFTITEDTASSNLFDLDTYFSGATSFTVSGNTSINLTIDTSNQVSITPSANVSGTQNLSFTGKQGSASQTSNTVVITITNVNDPPYLLANISNQSTAVNTSLTLDMAPYFADPDANQNLSYSISSTSHLSATQNSSKLSITPETNWEGSETITISASDGSYTAKSNNVSITVGSASTTSTNTAPSIDTFSPETDPTIAVGESQEFTITVSDTEGDPLTITWSVDGESQEDTNETFTFSSENEASFTITVTVSDGTTETTKSWTLVVGTGVIEEQDVASILAEQSTSAICGNKIVEEGEDCSSCALDFTCNSGFICEQGTCQAKKSAVRAIEILALSSIAIIVCAFLIYYFTTLKKRRKRTEASPMGYRPLGSKMAPPTDYTDFYKGKK